MAVLLLCGSSNFPIFVAHSKNSVFQLSTFLKALYTCRAIARQLGWEPQEARDSGPWRSSLRDGSRLLGQLLGLQMLWQTGDVGILPGFLGGDLFCPIGTVP